MSVADLLQDMPPKGSRIVVAMSGGVDSSVAAALMVEAGYDVVGMTMQLYDHGEAIQKKGACCAGQDIHDAREVAEKLGIPHYVLNYENRFKQSVMDDFADAYLAGETPIPCVKCNQTVKFRDMLGTAKELGAAALVTGHYVQRLRTEGGEVGMYRAHDAGKDQSYFLFATTPEQLDFLRFPLGGQPKEKTREQAERFGLKTADKPDSQDICFVPTGGYAAVLEKLRPGSVEPGEIVHVDGTVMGRHDGVIHYTVGQRRGLGIAHPEPLYVVRLEPETHRVIVGEKSALGRREFTLREVNWLASDRPLNGQGIPALVKVRSTQNPMQATLYAGEAPGTARVVLDEPEEAVAPGQACVAYDGSRVLGGGWIVRYL